PLFAKLDGRLIDPDVPVVKRHIELHLPVTAGHGDLGPLSKEMDRDGRNKVDVPAATGEWSTTLDTTVFDALPAAMSGACMVVVFVGLMEEDSTLDSTAKNAIQASKDKVQELADAALQTALANPATLIDPITPDSIIDQEAVENAAKSVIPGVVG